MEIGEKDTAQEIVIDSDHDNNKIDDNESIFVGTVDNGSDEEDQDITKRLKSDTQEENPITKPLPPKTILNREKCIITFSVVLPFQQRIVRELLQNDGLLIMAQGLGYLSIVSNLLHAISVTGDCDYSSPNKPLDKTQKSNLVIVLGLHDDEKDIVYEEMNELRKIDSPKTANKARSSLQIVGSDMDKTRRRKAYSKGGVFLVTPRVFIFDILSDAIDSQKITGMVVMHAERVYELSITALILKIFNDRNKYGFIKAISNQPERFVGFSPLKSAMKIMRVNQTFLWPRFHVSVDDSINLIHLQYMDKTTGQLVKPNAIDIKSVVELKIYLTDPMNEIQLALLESIESTVSTIRRLCGKLVDFGDLNLDVALASSFDTIIIKKLQPVWTKINPNAKLLVKFLRKFRMFLDDLLKDDPFTFYQKVVEFVEQHDTKKIDSSYTPVYITVPEFENVMAKSKRRIMEKDEYGGKGEEPPKWDQLSKILYEISMESQGSHNDNNGPILIMCSSNRLAYQLSLYLRLCKKVEKDGDVQYTGAILMNSYARAYQQEKANSIFNSNQQTDTHSNNRPESSTQPSSKYNKRRRVRGGKAQTVSVHANVRVYDHVEQSLNDTAGVFDFTEDFVIKGTENSFSKLINNNLIIIQTYEGSNMDTVLFEYDPSYIIMYEPNVPFTRHVELYRSSNPWRLVKTYLLYYVNSAEEQKYFHFLRNQNDIFKKLIDEKGQLPTVVGNETHDEDAPMWNMTIASTHRVAQFSIERNRVIVDTREFGANLPCALYSNKIDIIPVRLTIGDYILSPNICVERKSLEDLKGSFKSGRLYTQCKGMLHYYKTAILLIELGESTSSDSLLDFDESSGSSRLGNTKTDSEQLQAKLMLLLLQFPQLRIIWSSSPRSSAESFSKIKAIDKAQPDPEYSAKCGLDAKTLVSKSNRKLNLMAINVLKSIPGITTHNLNLIVEKVGSLQELVKMPESELAKILGKSNARKVFLFLNGKRLN